MVFQQSIMRRPYHLWIVVASILAVDVIGATTRTRKWYQNYARDIYNSHRLLGNEELHQDRPKEFIVTIEGSEEPIFSCPECPVQEQQDDILTHITARYPNAHLVTSTQKLVNALFVQFPVSLSGDSDLNLFLRTNIPGVSRVIPHGDLRTEGLEALEMMDGIRAQREFCATGNNVTIAVLDGGVDYTHELLGGPGTMEAYEAAYGMDGDVSVENTERDNLFPTSVVVDGYDFVGDTSTYPFADTQGLVGIYPDDDPIDNFGHGTAVADAILTIAPGAKLVALKVCGRFNTCPLFAIIQGIEFSVERKVDVINLSLGYPFASPYYSYLAQLLEKVVGMGITVVASAGNEWNIPYVLGSIPGSPGVLSVGATAKGNFVNRFSGSTFGGRPVASYSSRGPTENNMLKPDIVAPSGLTLAAAGTGKSVYAKIYGTSFSGPLVSGAVALLKGRCPECSPFGIKTMLMNNADHTARYDRFLLRDNSTAQSLLNSSQSGRSANLFGSKAAIGDGDGDGEYTLAPVTLMGAGELQIHKALDADFWGYSVEDAQPSVHLGLVSAASDVRLTRSIKVINLLCSDKSQTLSISSVFVGNKTKEAWDALAIEFDPPQQVLTAECNSEVEFQVSFVVDASMAPPNAMTSTGYASNDPRTLDINEFSGHIVLRSEETLKHISLPFLVVIRQAANVTIDQGAGLPGLEDTGDNSALPTRLTNNGAGVAQIDVFQLLSTSPDDPESGYGARVVPSDIKYTGVRVLRVDQPQCLYLFEFAINTHERKLRLVWDVFNIEVDTDGDGDADYVLLNSVERPGGAASCFVADLSRDRSQCTSFSPDHGTNSANTILRACSEDFGMSEPGTISVRFVAMSVTERGEVVMTDYSTAENGGFFSLSFPTAGVSVPSFDVYPGESQEVNMWDGSAVKDVPAGLMLVTNAYRHRFSTGASTPESETLIILRSDVDRSELPLELTKDILVLPKAQDLQGPKKSWSSQTCGDLQVTPHDREDGRDVIYGKAFSEYSADNDAPMIQVGREPCPLVEIPRARVPTRAPSSTPSEEPSDAPSAITSALTPEPTKRSPFLAPPPLPLPAASQSPDLSMTPKSEAITGEAAVESPSSQAPEQLAQATLPNSGSVMLPQSTTLVVFCISTVWLAISRQ